MTVPASPSQTPRPDSAAPEGAERSPFYITTAIHYVNDLPHIGHMYENTVADVFTFTDGQVTHMQAYASPDLVPQHPGPG